MLILNNTTSAFESHIRKESSGTALVLDVRLWPGSNLLEIDLHLPSVNMLDWIDVMQVTFCIGKACFWDSIPFGWDAETATCSILIDTAQDSFCAKWATQLRHLDQVAYTKICSYSGKLHRSNLIVGIADGSNLGFLLALQQVVKPAYRFEAFALIKESDTAKLFNEYFNISATTVTSQRELISLIVSQEYCANHTSFYLSEEIHPDNNICKSLEATNYGNIHVLPFGR